jgi:carbon monoxide dehydrogenase subunit G
VSRALLLIAFLLLSAPASPAETEFRRITVTPKGDGYFCDSEMVISVPPALAFEVMTDYDSMAKWVPNLRSSRVVKREGAVVHVEQVGIARFGPLSFDFTMVRRGELDPPKGIALEQVQGTLRRYRSRVLFAQERGATRLTYLVEIEPGLLLGAILSKDFIEHEIREQFEAIAAEMVRRHALAAAASAPAR